MGLPGSYWQSHVMLSSASLDFPSVPYWYEFLGISTNVFIASSVATGRCPINWTGAFGFPLDFVDGAGVAAGVDWSGLSSLYSTDALRDVPGSMLSSLPLTESEGSAMSWSMVVPKFRLAALTASESKSIAAFAGGAAMVAMSWGRSGEV